MFSFKDKFCPILFFSFLVSLFFATPAIAISLTATNDTYTSSKSHKSKHQKDGNLYIEDSGHNKKTKSTYVKFDTSIVSDDINGDDVLKASLRIFINKVKNPGMVHVYRVLGPWNEKTLKSNQVPPNESLPLASVMVNKADNKHFRHIDITEAVKEWFSNPVTNDGLVLIAEGARIRVDSKENILTGHAMEVELNLTNRGEQGIQGPPGPQGIQGLTGIKGDNGEQGLAGEAGPSGPQGIQGSSGPQGIQGIQGLTGIQGAKGEQGIAGEKGEQGPVGLPGGSVRNIITVAIEGGDFTSIQAAIDSIPERVIPDANSIPPEIEVTPTLIKIAPGEYFGQLVLRSNIQLLGAGRGQTIIRPAQNNSFNNCGSDKWVICLNEVNNIEISDLTISGLAENNGDFAEDAIKIRISSDIYIHDNRISDVQIGVNGVQGVGNIIVRNNHIPTPADAIVISMANDPGIGASPQLLISIIANQIDSGSIQISGNGSVQIMGNTILGNLFNSWSGKLQVTGNQIIGDIEFDAVHDSLFSNNILLGKLLLGGPKNIVVVGNSLSANGFVITDNGNASIVGNSLQSSSNPILIQPSGSSTIFANSYEGPAGNSLVHNSLVSRHSIMLESKDEDVTIKAGGSNIQVDSSGNITIDSGGDITLSTVGKFTVNANNIKLKSKSGTTVEAAGNLNLKSSATTSIIGGAKVDIDAGSIVDIDAGIITLN